MSAVPVPTARRKQSPLVAATRFLQDHLAWLTAAHFLLTNDKLRPEYAMSWRRKLRLSYRMYRNWRDLDSASHFKSQLLIAVKLMELDPAQEGVVVECGSYKGVSTANLSLACDVVGRTLVVYDSFEGLPTPEDGDNYAPPTAEGLYAGTLAEVRETVRCHGVVERCEFRKGWFDETLPNHSEPIVAVLIDVDFQSSIDDCVRNLWPHLVDGGHLFTDDYMKLDKCALFFSERYWKTHFDSSPPGLYGSGTGVQLGQYYAGPAAVEATPLQLPRSTAYTYKKSRAIWEFYPDG